MNQSKSLEIFKGLQTSDRICRDLVEKVFIQASFSSCSCVSSLYQSTDRKVLPLSDRASPLGRLSQLHSAFNAIFADK